MQELHVLGLALLHEEAQEPQRPGIARHLLAVEQEPAHHLEFLGLGFGAELAELAGEIGQDRARLCDGEIAVVAMMH